MHVITVDMPCAECNGEELRAKGVMDVGPGVKP